MDVYDQMSFLGYVDSSEGLPQKRHIKSVLTDHLA